MVRSSSIHSASGIGMGISLFMIISYSILGGLDVYLYFVLPLMVVLFSEARWPCERYSLSDKLMLVICHLDLFLYTLLSAQPCLEAKL